MRRAGWTSALAVAAAILAAAAGGAAATGEDGSQSAARFAKASSRSASLRVSRRSGSVVPTPSTPLTSPAQRIGATIALRKPRYAGCGTASGTCA